MGSSGGGSAGKVDYAEYLKTFHGLLLDNATNDIPLFSITDIFNEACVSSPFDSAITYSGRTPLGTPNSSMAQALAEILGMSIADGQYSVDLVSVNSALDNTFNTESIQQQIQDYKETLQADFSSNSKQYDANAIILGSCFSSSFILHKDRALSKHHQTLMDKSLEDLTASILQLNNSKLSTTLDMQDKRIDTLRLGRACYAMLIESVKLDLLNEREYFDQNLYYVKHGAHWKFECAQEVANAIAEKMGKRLQWVPSPDVPKLVQTLGIIAGVGAGDIAGVMLYRKNKRFRFTVQGATSGALMTGWSGFGAIIGAVIGGVYAYLTYSEGDWR